MPTFVIIGHNQSRKESIPMKKKCISLILAVIILISLVPFGVSAAEVMTTSSDAVKMLKAEEGFSRTPYWDYAQWTVGYGTKCPDDMLDYYKQYGITEAEAESLLCTYLSLFESEIIKFMSRTGVTLTQNQFDALVLFSYNCGSGWSYETSGTFYNAIVNGATGNDLIYAFCRWSSAGGQVQTYLLRRRLCEANMYLNGEYSQTPPSNYGYVLYDANGGKVSPSVQGYDAALTAQIVANATYEGHTFDGWYTAAKGGTKVTVLDPSVKNARLYAHWSNGESEPSVDEPAQEPAGVTVTVSGSDVNVRKGPGTNYETVGTKNKGDQLEITETATGSGYTWGKFTGGWICLKYTDYDTVTQEKEEEEQPQQPSSQTRTGTVKVNDSLRIRSGPSTGYSIAGYLHNGDRVEILEQQIVGSMIWGRIDKGWISLDYVELDPVQEEEPKEETPEDTTETTKVTGTVNVKDFLRIRKGPSTSTDVVGYLKPNDKVEILEQTTSSSMTWGRIAQGWISMDYVVLDSSDSKPEQTATGKVKVNDFLRVRTGPGTSYAIAGYLSNDTAVEVLEQKTVGSTRWGKIDKGWISLDYVVMDGQSSTAVTKTVTADCLRIRSDAGTSHAIVGYLYNGAKVEILETKTVGGTQWGRTEKGWISMDYVK